MHTRTGKSGVGRIQAITLVLTFACLFLLGCFSFFPRKGTGYSVIHTPTGEIAGSFPPNTRWLGFKENTEINYNDLVKFRKLESLELSSHKIQSIDGIQKSSQLQFLNLNRTSIKDLRPINSLPKLHTLLLDFTEISESELVPLKGLSAITNLSLTGTNVRELSFIPKTCNLHRLDLRDTLVHDLTPLSACKDLNDLQIGGTQVRHLEPLFGLENLQYLGIDGLPIKKESIWRLRQELPYLKVVRWKVPYPDLLDSIPKYFHDVPERP